MNFGVTRNTYSAHSFSEKMVDRSGQLEECNSSVAQIRTLYLDRQLSRNIAKKSVITNSMQLMPKKSAEFCKKNCGDRNWNFVKLVNKVFQEIPEFFLRYDCETKKIEDQTGIEK